jgi:hypothetical protein
MVEGGLKQSSDEHLPNPIPRVLFERGQDIEAQGDKLAAADLYEEAGYIHKALQIFEAEGLPLRAYDLAKRTGDNWTADRLAVTYSIAHHEYSDFPPAQGREFSEVVSIALKSRLHPEATAGNLGFRGFADRIVADIGTRDGRFVSLIHELGASEVYGIDPDQGALQKAIDKGILDKKHALPYKLQELPDEMRKIFETATIFNFNMPYAEQPYFFEQLYHILPENGQVIMTVAEDEILQNARQLIDPFFKMRMQRLWHDDDDYPHKNLVVLTKRATILRK